MSNPLLQIVVASTRPGRIGLPVARWFEAEATSHGGFDIDFADLAEIALPFMDEPKHPRFKDYTHEHTLAWSARVEAADAFAFVLPEYNHGMTAPLKNAIDFLNQEWRHKPVGLVSYGGVSAGLRAAGQVKQVVSALGMTEATTAVSIPFVQGFLNDAGEIEPNDVMTDAAKGMLDELLALHGALSTLRAG